MCNLLLNTHVVIITGWIKVQRGVRIDLNLEEYSLNIKTHSTIGSDDKVSVKFYTSQGVQVGGLSLLFTTGSTPQYNIGSCIMVSTDFLTSLPTDNDKVWRVTLTRTLGIRLVVHCNEEEVLNFLISDSTCSDYSEWSTDWSREVAKIKFLSGDTASDYYQPQPGSCVF